MCDPASSIDSPSVLEADSDLASSVDFLVLAGAGSTHVEPSTTFPLSYRGSRRLAKQLPESLVPLLYFGQALPHGLVLAVVFPLGQIVIFRPLLSPPVGCPKNLAPPIASVVLV